MSSSEPESLRFADTRSSVKQMTITKGENGRKYSGQRDAQVGRRSLADRSPLPAFFWFLAAEGTAVCCWQVGTCSGGGCWAGRAVASGAASARLAESVCRPHPALRPKCAPVAGVTKQVDFGGQIVALFLTSGCDLGKLLNLLWFS